MNRLLRIPNWLLFTLVMVIPNIFQQTDAGLYIHTFFGILVVFWMIKVGEQLFQRIEGRTTLNFNLYAIGLLFILAYFSLVFLLTDGYYLNSKKDNYAEYGNLLYIYTTGHIISLAVFFYGLHFTASAIQILEIQLFGQRTSYSLLLAALFFFPIGIWWTQPKINRILRTPLEDEPTRKISYE